MTVEQDQTLLIEDEIQTLKRRIASLEEFEMNVAHGLRNAIRRD